MLINGVEFRELSRPEDNSPREQGSRDGVDVLRSFWQPGPCDEAAKMAGRAALLGYAALKEEACEVAGDYLGKKRRWVERVLPHAYATAGGPWSDGDDPYVYASSIESCVPVSHDTAAAAFPEVGPSSRRGFVWRVKYAAWPWIHREDSAVLATVGPLKAAGDAGGTALFPGKPARPDEGEALESGWLSSRYVARFVRWAGRTISLPNGLLEFTTDATDPVSPGTPKQPLPVGLPFLHAKMDVEYHWWTPLSAVPHEQIAKTLNKTNNDTFDFMPQGCAMLWDYEFTNEQGFVGDRRMSLVRYKVKYAPNYDEASGTFRGHNAFIRTVDGRIRFWPFRPKSTAGGAIPGVVHTQVDYSALFRPPQETI